MFTADLSRVVIPVFFLLFRKIVSLRAHFEARLKTERNDSVIYSLIPIKLKSAVVFLWLQRVKHKLTERETSDGGSVQILQKEIKKKKEASMERPPSPGIFYQRVW